MTTSEKAIAEFLAKGGKIRIIEEGKTSKDFDQNQVDPYLKNCPCGCHGNYTDHSMRLGERGIY